MAATPVLQATNDIAVRIENAHGRNQGLANAFLAARVAQEAFRRKSGRRLVMFVGQDGWNGVHARSSSSRLAYLRQRSI